MDDKSATREMALRTVVQDRQAENLLDFDEPDPPVGGTGLASIIMGGEASSNPATAKILTSSNPLDDLVPIFGDENINARDGEGSRGIGHSTRCSGAAENLRTIYSIRSDAYLHDKPHPLLRGDRLSVTSACTQRSMRSVLHERLAQRSTSHPKIYLTPTQVIVCQALKPLGKLRPLF